jgi:hypothetical protein
MSTPGFTAEAALYKTFQPYYMVRTAIPIAGAVQPAQYQSCRSECGNDSDCIHCCRCMRAGGKASHCCF